jgi:hypothetical protein
MLEVTKAILDKVKGIALTADMHSEAESKGMAFSAYLENLLAEKGIVSDFHGKTNSDRQRAKAIARAQGKEAGVSAFDLFMKANDGSFNDTVAKWITTPNLNVLFPEYFANRLYVGAMASSLVPYFCTQRITVDGFKFESPTLESPTRDKRMRKIAHGAEIPTVNIKVGTESVAIPKFAIGVEMTYEQMRYQRLDFLGVTLRQIGLQLGVDQTEEFLYTVGNGDGNSNGLQSGNIKNVKTTNVIAKVDLFTFWRALSDGYQINVYVGSKANMILVDDLVTSLTNPEAQLAAVQTEQRRKIPAGYEWNGSMYYNSSVVTDHLQGWDRDNTGVYVTNDNVMLSESERIVRSQKVLTTAAMYGCFRINDKNSIGALNITL